MMRKRMWAIGLILSMLLTMLVSFPVFAAEETIRVPVEITGMYEGVNAWEGAVYTYTLTDGTPAESGLISNGKYNFKYFPATGQIKNTAQSKSFSYETGFEGVDIVIPTKIGALKDANIDYPAKDIVLYAQNANYGIFRYYSALNNAKIIIPEGVTKIPNNVFAQLDKGTSPEFILPSTLIEIGSNAFAMSSGGGLNKNIIIPESVTTIGGSAFSNCRFQDIVIPSGVTSVSGNLLAFTTNLKNVTFQGEITSIGSAAFRKANSLKTITFEGKNAPSTINANAFQEVTTSFTVYFPANGIGYDDDAFRSKFPAGVTFERLPGEPLALNVNITGKNVVDTPLTAEYTYEDPMDRPESGSFTVWTSCESEDFSSSEVFTLKEEPCSADNPSTYQIQETDDGKFIRATITVKNADAELNTGLPVSATLSEKVRLPQTIPMVTLTAPSDGYMVNCNHEVTFSATATCDNTTISLVEFYANDVKVAESRQEPYTAVWTPTEMGTYKVYARAYNAIGEDQTSEESEIQVLSEDAEIDAYIDITFTSPAPQSFTHTGTPVRFTGTAAETSGSEITSISVYANGALVGESKSASFDFTQILEAGTYAITAVAKSVDGKTGRSKAFDIMISGMSFSKMMSDNMVLQRNKPIKLSGFGVDGTTVTAELLGKTASAPVQNRKWTITMPAMPTTKSTTLTFTASDGVSKTFQNIAIGEVLICSGQSNMTAPIGNSHSFASSTPYDGIRLFTTPRGENKTPMDDVSGGTWNVSTTALIKTFSAIGYLTGYHYYLSQNGEVPVGIIQSAVSGTGINQWIPNNAFSYDPDLKGHGTTNTHYNSMIAPWTNYTIGHILWYQGESDSFHNRNYEKQLTAYIDSNREAFGDENINFIIVQLPTYDAVTQYKSPFRSFWLVREGQYNVSEHIDNVETAITIDTGSTVTVHPGGKEKIGKRTGLILEHFAEPDSKVIWKSPTFDRFEVNGTKATVYFDNVGDGLKTTDNLSPKGFKIAGDDLIFKDTEATLTGSNTVELDISSIQGQLSIRYAWEDAPVQTGTSSGVNLVNSADLPAAPFKTDNAKEHYKSYDSETGVYSNLYNFTPMVRYIKTGDINNGKAIIEINARDYDDKVASVELFIDNVSAGNATQISEDIWQYEWDGATEGSHTFHAIATDINGTTSTKIDASFGGSTTVTPRKFTLELSANNITISFNQNGDAVAETKLTGGVLTIAAYNSNDELIKMCSSESATVELPAADITNAVKIKAFLFKDTKSFIPLCKSTELAK